MSIGLGRFQKIVSSLEGLRQALFDMDEDVFTLDDLYLLQRLLPDAEEIQKARRDTTAPTNMHSAYGAFSRASCLSSDRFFCCYISVCVCVCVCVLCEGCFANKSTVPHHTVLIRAGSSVAT